MMRQRPAFIAAMLVTLAAGAWLYFARSANRPAHVRIGPVVFISIDTLRADRLPLYGSTRTRTPNIDRLAGDGVVFENAYAHSPQTLPSHTSILSGELPFEHGVRDNIGFNVRTGERFLQHDLKEAGFATGAFVSAYVLRAQTGFNQGFDTFDDKLPPVSPEEPLGQVQRGGDRTVAAAIKWIDDQSTRAGSRKPEAESRFFLFTHIYEPHTPYTPPARFAKPDPYDGEVEYADEIVGKLLDHLRAKGFYDEAMIVLFADHGEGLGDHGEDEHGIFLYRETIHVPLVIKLPGSRGGGRRVATPVQHIDLVPTVLDLLRIDPTGRNGNATGDANAMGRLKPAPTDERNTGRLKPAPTSGTSSNGNIVEAGFSRPDRVEAGFSRPEPPARRELRGRSLLPLLERTGDIAPTNIYSEALSPRYHFGWSELYALSDDRYRFIRAPKDELYDLSQDAKEMKSIAADRPQVHSAMRAALQQMIAGSRVTAPSAVSASDREKLAALGYVGTQSGPAAELPGDRLPDPKDRVEVLRMYRQAMRLSNEGKFDEAATAFRRLLADDPGMSDVSLKLADTYNRQGQPEKALAAYKQVIDRDPKNGAALTGATAALLRLGRLEEAKAHAELTVTVAPAIAHEMLARIAVHQHDESAARRHAELAQQADPSLQMVAFVDGMILHERGQYAAAAQRLLEAKRAMAARTEQLADLNYLAGDSLARLERYPEAEQLFRAELSVFPSHIRARGGLAMLYKATGRDAEAARAVDDIVRLSPTPEGLDTAARLWTMFGEPARAAQVRARMGNSGQAR